MKGKSTLSTHASDLLSPVNEQPMSVPIWQVGDYAYDSAEHYADVINERRAGQVYGRYGGPTVEVLANVLASLENAEAGWVFASGMGAIHAALMHVARSGSRIVAGRSLYGGTYGLLTDAAARVNIQVEFIDAADAATVAAALKLDDVAAVFVETVSNPTFETADLEGISALTRKHQIPFVVDNTVPTPVLANPLASGGDLVVHSTSKYIAGHHDLMGGAVVGPRNRIDDVRHLAIAYGTTASAFESWLTLRGVATLTLRMERHVSNAAALRRVLDESKKVVSVAGFGGMLAADLGSQESAYSFVNRLKVARVGSSFGGVRTEVTHPASTSHRQYSQEDRRAAGIGDGLVRISVGIEDIEDLIADFQEALE